MILPVILSGGSGTRLWPLSRKKYPKQFLPLCSDENGETTMLQKTIQRLDDMDTQAPIVICNHDHRFIAAEQLRRMNCDDASIILEPVARNTAPAIALAALKALKNGDDPLLLVLAADHELLDAKAFCVVVENSVAMAEQGKFVTFGVVPHCAETGYGYIRRGNAFDAGYHVAEFVEKPPLEVAQQYLESGQFYWNSGMFLFKASRYLEVLKQYAPDIYAACEKSMLSEHKDLDFFRIDEAAFAVCPSDSIDYAVMEPLCARGESVVVMPLEAGWSDVGGFSALWNVKTKDEQGNATQGDVNMVETKNSLILAEERMVATIGIEDLVVVSTKDAVLVAHKEKAQAVKTIVAQLQQEGRDEVNVHREVFRPWGSYDAIDYGEGYQVKRISVKAGAKLSVQKHHHRAEHWIVVSGIAKVTNGDKEILLTENQSTYIPVGVIHALENPGVIPLELIEVQSGSYLGEDDIVRYEDLYGRT